MNSRLALMNATYRLWRQFTAGQRDSVDGPARKQRPLPGDVIGGLAAPIAEKLDRFAGWDRLPPKLGVFTLLGIRHQLRARNLYETGVGGPPSAAAEQFRTTPPEQFTTARTPDGSGNDLAKPWMGAAKTPFGRNAPPVSEDATIDAPPATVVSKALLTREGEYFPAEGLNMLAAAWVQFEVHDWFAHQTDRYDPGFVARRAGKPDDEPSEPPPFKRDISGSFVSDQTHWWDASQLYGADEDFARALREFDGGRVKVDDELLEAMEPFIGRARPGTDAERRQSDTSAAVPNLWLGTALFHILFAKEHNSICRRLRHTYPSWDDGCLYNKARLINAALMAKIHTVEWTPAIIGHPATLAGLRATWWGILGEDYRKRYGRVGPDEILSGIPGSRRSHDGASYALTEEFVAVYRMHPLIPDAVALSRRIADDAETDSVRFEDLVVRRDSFADQRREWLEELTPARAFYSLGRAHPGELTLHNYPRFLQEFRPVDSEAMLDLGEVDIRRTRETGVPRYNNFRRLFRLQPASSFHEIANGNPKWAREIQKVYCGDLEAVDLLIGLFAERKPKGFAFSDTTFRVFLLMAARRLRSDRFFTTDYTTEMYTRVGLEWIAETTLSDVLIRHYPDLAAALAKTPNPFRPWVS